MNWVAKRSRSKVKFFQYGTLFIIAAYAYYVIIQRKRSPSNVDVISVKGTLMSLRYSERKELTSRKHSSQKKNDVIKSHTTKKIVDPSSNIVVTKKKEVTVGVNNLGCSHSWKTDWEAIERRGKTLINLDPNRFIYPVLVNGPNNQLIGLRDTLYLAVRLNRTVIMPHFYKHKTDTSRANGSSKLLPASQRIDVSSVAALMSVKPFNSIQDVCEEGFDDMYFTSYKLMHSSLAHITEELGIPIHVKQNGESIDEYPKDIDPSFSASSQVKSDRRSLHKLYGSPGTCALYVKPYRTVGVKESPGSLRQTWRKYFSNGTLNNMKHLNIEAMSDKDLYALIVHSTPKPKHITEIVNDFMSSYGLNDIEYISVHWRYDPVDWQVRCRKNERLINKGKDFLIEMCNKVKHTEPRDLAKAILKFIRSLQAKKKINKIDAVYIAAPLNMEDFIEEVELKFEEALEEEGIDREVHILTHLDLKDHLRKYSTCEGLKENYEDIFSQLEMDICSRATVFLRSPSSSWSKVIREVRVVKTKNEKYDGNIFELAWRVAEKRINDN